MRVFHGGLSGTFLRPGVLTATAPTVRGPPRQGRLISLSGLSGNGSDCCPCEHTCSISTATGACRLCCHDRRLQTAVESSIPSRRPGTSMPLPPNERLSSAGAWIQHYTTRPTETATGTTATATGIASSRQTPSICRLPTTTSRSGFISTSGSPSRQRFTGPTFDLETYSFAIADEHRFGPSSSTLLSAIRGPT
jgi:hypothetical protein